MAISTNVLDSQHPDQPPERGNVVVLLETLVRHAWLILTLALLVGIGVVIQALTEGRVYAAESAFVLDSDRSAVSGVSGIAAQFGIAIPQNGDAQSPGFYADLLRSPTILRPLVDSGVVVPGPRGPTVLRPIDSIPGPPGDRALRRARALQRLQDRIGTSFAQRTGVVTLRVLHPSPQVALAINQRMLALLSEFNITRKRTQATTQRTFVEERTLQARDALHGAEERLRVFLAGNRGFIPSSEASFERQRLERDVSTRSQIYLALLQSFEQSKVEEMRSAPLIAVIQQPELPATPEPRRLARKGIVGFLIGALLGLFIAYVIESIRRIRDEHPEEVAALSRAFADLRRNWHRPWRAAARGGVRSVR